MLGYFYTQSISTKYIADTILEINFKMHWVKKPRTDWKAINADSHPII